MNSNIFLFLLLYSSARAFVPRQVKFGIRIQRTRRHVLGEEYFDMEELRQRIKKSESSTQYHVLYPKEWENRTKPTQVNIVFFKPDTEDQGVHTIEFPKGSGNNFILAFESMQECALFASKLREQQFFDPKPCQVNLENLESSCEQSGVNLQFIPEGTEIKPPTENVNELGHNPNLREDRWNLDQLFSLSESVLNEPGVDTGFDAWE